MKAKLRANGTDDNKIQRMLNSKMDVVSGLSAATILSFIFTLIPGHPLLQSSLYQMATADDDDISLLMAWMYCHFSSCFSLTLLGLLSSSPVMHHTFYVCPRISFETPADPGFTEPYHVRNIEFPEDLCYFSDQSSYTIDLVYEPRSEQF